MWLFFSLAFATIDPMQFLSKLMYADDVLVVVWEGMNATEVEKSERATVVDRNRMLLLLLRRISQRPFSYYCGLIANGKMNSDELCM